MKKVTLTKNLNIPGYGMLEKGLKLNVTKFNSRYIYTDLNGCELRLVYSDTNAKKATKRLKSNYVKIKDEKIDAFLSGKTVTFFD